MKRIPSPPDPDIERFCRRLDWNLLRTYVTIVQEGGVSRAAYRLHLSQPSVSHALKRLEEQLGRQLIERGAGMFRLTEAGETLYRESREIHGSVGRLALLLNEVEDRVRGHVTLAMASHVVSPILDGALAAFTHGHPGVTFSIDVMTSTDVAHAVLEKRVSVGVALVRHRLPELDYRLFFRERFGFFCGPGHRLFGRPDLTLADLAGEPTVSFRTDMMEDVLRPVALWRAREDLDTTIVASSNHLEEVRRLVMAGVGIAPLPIHAVRPEVDAGRLWRLPPHDGDGPPMVSVFVISNPRAHLGRGERLFIDALHHAIEQVPLEARHY